MISRNLKLTKKRKYNSWVKVNLGSWKVTGDSQIYCELKITCAEAKEYIAKLNSTSEEKITITHFFGKVMGKVLAEVPDLNVLVKFGKIYYRDDVNIFFQVADNEDLSGYCVKNIDKKTIEEIAIDLNQSAKRIRAHKDPTFQKIKSSWKFIPTYLSKPILGLIRFLFFGLNIHIKGLGLPKDPFGGLMITNIGSLGFDSGFAPLPPYSEVPFLIALGKMGYHPVCDEKGNISANMQVSICITMDHRIIDGYRGAKVVEKIKYYFANPEKVNT